MGEGGSLGQRNINNDRKVQCRNASSTALVLAAVLSGFELSTHIARKRSGWSPRFRQVDDWEGTSRRFVCPVIAERSPREFPHNGCNHECKLFVPLRPKLPVNKKRSFSKYELSVELQPCWMPSRPAPSSPGQPESYLLPARHLHVPLRHGVSSHRLES